MKNRFLLLGTLIFQIAVGMNIYSQNESIAYIFAQDSANGLSFKNLLDANNYSITLIEIDEVTTTNFGEYELIIICHHSGFVGGWTPEAVANIQNSNKPVLGLGYGGALLFEEMGLSISWAHGWITLDSLCNADPCRQIFCVDTTQSIFNYPNQINIPNSSILTLYDYSGWISLYEPHLSDSVLYIGRQIDNFEHYIITTEGELYCLWGFGNSPYSMTEVGKDLFINTIHFCINGLIVNINELNIRLPDVFTLSQNYPNPFNPSTSIQYTISDLPTGQAGMQFVSLKVYDILGNEVATLVNSEKPSGVYEVEWNAANLPSGVYFYQLQTGSFVQTKKMILLR